MDDLDKAIEICPDLIQAYNNRGDVFRKLEKYEQAIRDYTKAIGLDGVNIQAYKSRGASYNMLDDMERSCNDFKKACELSDCTELEALQKSGRCPASE
jgi:tetratricopeptide (TPR) repeat protein